MLSHQQSISDDMKSLLKQLIINGSTRIAETVLFVYFQRNWKIDDNLAAHYVVRYFQKYFPKQLAKHQQSRAKTE
ncbi:hypothetical protein [Cohnella sp. AR92]|uniref:hypothetical protein n=1 Tax=Cohnella sp. AR92 TaxID=648716 RepID=UPI000F8F7C25|nr:hypothetical protein [Cohnella sp. AR92]RUS48854.1 hypothetical protein ELR57_00445 [Cohnella sp. AR92]